MSVRLTRALEGFLIPCGLCVDLLMAGILRHFTVGSLTGLDEPEVKQKDDAPGSL